ncbi:MAG TPA: MarR family transcriptional regulator [Burkholderiales bacterium]|nr:MarR family transcriptional regulator [Burkholderiales bacterium]
MKTNKASSPASSAAIAPETLSLDNQLCFALYSTSLTMSKVYKPLLNKLGVTYSQYVVLLALWEKDNVMVSELGDRVYLDSGTLTPLLKRLEVLGLIRRNRATDDERRVLVNLTDKGRELRNQTQEVTNGIHGAVQCSADEAKTLTRRLQKLRGALSKSILK